MNMRTWFLVSVAIALLIIVIRTPLIAALIAMLVMGIIPGTTLMIPAWIILLLYPLLFVGAIIYLTKQSFLIGAPPKSPPVKQPNRLKKRRTSQSATTRKCRPVAKGQKA